MRAYQARPDREWTRATAPQKPRAAAWVGVLAAALLAWGCEAPGGDDHAAPRDVEAAPDVADTADAVEMVDGVDGQGDGSDIVAGDDGGPVDVEVKNCPPGTQIEGCPCVKQTWNKDYGCCLGINRGLTCSGPKGAEAWGVVYDCCTKEEPYCGYPRPSGWDPLCLSKPLP